MVELECSYDEVKGSCPNAWLMPDGWWPARMKRDWLRLHDALEAAEERIGDLERELADAQRTISNWSDALPKADARITDLERQLAQRDTREDVLKERLSEVTRQAGMLKRQLAERGERDRELADKLREKLMAMKDDACKAGNWERAAAIRDAIATADPPAKEKPERIEVKCVNNSGGLDYRWLIWVDERCEAYGYANSYDQARLDAQAVADQRWPEAKE